MCLKKLDISRIYLPTFLISNKNTSLKETNISHIYLPTLSISSKNTSLKETDIGHIYLPTPFISSKNTSLKEMDIGHIYLPTLLIPSKTQALRKWISVTFIFLHFNQNLCIIHNLGHWVVHFALKTRKIYDVLYYMFFKNSNKILS